MTPPVPRLIHLNGPPGIGKSTLAQLYVDEHPGVLNLDIDQVRALIGGWQEHFDEAGELARPIALAMAGTHLRGGRDVIMPQYLGRIGEIERFEAAAVDNGATFREIVLMDTRERSIERFSRRGDGEELPWHDQIRQVVGQNGGEALLSQMYDQLHEVLELRPSYRVVPSHPGAIRETYEALRSALDD